MNKSQRFWRAFFIIFFIAALCGGMALPVTGGIPAYAASTSIVISEFRTSGPNGANDEFIELYNLSTGTVNTGNWKISYSPSTGGTPTDRYTFPAGSTLSPGQYFLLANSSGYSGSTTPDATYTTPMADDGGIAVLNASGTPIDQVGMSSGSVYKEGTILTPLSGTADHSYERKIVGQSGNCNDADNNAADFILNPSSSNPDNMSSTPLPCLGVTNVFSPTGNGTYNAGAVIDIAVVFRSAVDVTGAPTLTLDTGITDTAVSYAGGSGTNTLHFSYTVGGTDSSVDLDYISINALALNGGSIIGPLGNAALTLPAPGTPGSGSLGASNDIRINNGANPSVLSFVRQSPSVELTHGQPLTFRITFSEAVTGVDATDFVPTGTTATPATPVRVHSNVYDVTISGGDLNTVNGPVGLNLNPAPTINDGVGNPLPPGEPPIDETYTLDNIAPTVNITVPASQPNPTGVLPVNFTVTFSEPIVPTSFTPSDITQTGTASSVIWSITEPPVPGDHTTFTLSATSLLFNGPPPPFPTLIPSIPAGSVTDAAGNGNLASTNSTVIFNDTTPPTVTIEQASGQLDPTSALPVRFTIVFSEPIDTRVFTPADITQNGTATGVTWSIADSGDHRTFTLSATGVAGAGTLFPFIAANRVTDLVGNNNLASPNTSTDANTVTFSGTGSLSVVISEFRTQGPNGANDEFIELYNPTSNWVDISNWKINASASSGSGSTRATIPASTILRPGQYYLVANSSGYNSSMAADLTYSTGITDDGGIALLRSNGTIVDQVGMSSTSVFKEGTALAPFPLPGGNDRSYERRPGGTAGSCQDINNNVNDFLVVVADPKNSSSPMSLCGGPLSTPVPTTITITAHTPDPSLSNAYVSVSVKVIAGTSPVPAGAQVSITGANTNCTLTLNSSGTGSCSVRFTSTGTKTITATYLGDNTHTSSTTAVTHSVVVISPTKYRTRTPTPLPPPPLVGINEFLPRPGHDWNHDGVINTGDEYIEIINFGVINVSLSGYSLDDEVNIGSSPYRLPSVTMKPGDRMVFYGSQTGIHLDDGGDGVRLLKSNGQLADAYNYSVVRFPDESFCRLPDNGGLDDWNQFCFPTPGLPNSASQSSVNPPTTGNAEDTLCPIADTLPDDFVFAECQSFGKNIWNPDYWDLTGWFDEKTLPGSPNKWPLFGD